MTDPKKPLSPAAKAAAELQAKQHPVQKLNAPPGSAYYHTRPTPIEKPAGWRGPYWPQMDCLDTVPDAIDDTWVTAPGVTLPPPDWVGAYQRNRPLAPAANKTRKAWIVGGGLAGMSVAFYLIRDAGFTPSNITILEAGSFMGGALDAYGDAKKGYIMRGGREMTWNHHNLWDMFADVPALELPAPYSLLDEFRILNDADGGYSKARLIHKEGEVMDFSTFTLSAAQQEKLTALQMLRIEETYDLTITDYFDEAFFKTDFWIYWRTQYGFSAPDGQSLLQMKLYMHRFTEGAPGMNNLSCMKFSKYNQTESWVNPLWKMLSEQGVKVQYKTLVEDVDMAKGTAPEGETMTVTSIRAQVEGKPETIAVGPQDVVFATTGSVVAGTAYGATDQAPQAPKDQSGEWNLWRNLAKKSPIFGDPDKACGDPKASVWMSATVTVPMSSPLVEKVNRDYAINPVNSGRTVTGGIVTAVDSNWLISFNLERQPYFLNQPEDVCILWFDGLDMDKPGNKVPKKMGDCTGRETLEELCHHMGLDDRFEEISKGAIVRTSVLPYVTAFFRPYGKGDRPDVVPDGVTNLGLIGQFVDMQNDVSFTTESSVRTARAAVYKLLGVAKQVPDISPTQYDLRRALASGRALNNYQPTKMELQLRSVLKGTYYEDILPPEQDSVRAEDPAQLG